MRSTRARASGLSTRFPLAERAVADLAIRCGSRAEYRRELAALLGRMLPFERLVIGAERDAGSAPSATDVEPDETLSVELPSSAPLDSEQAAPPVVWRWRSAVGRHWLEVASAQGMSAEVLAAWTQLLPTIKLAEAHWLAVEGLRSGRVQRAGETALGPKSTARARAGDSSATPPRAFVSAVRDALRHLHEVTRLAKNPLLEARVVVASTSSEGRIRALQQLLLELVRELGTQSTTVFWHRALHHTYVEPANTQLRAAELSHTSYGSYRRFVSRGVSEVAMRMWLLELGATEK